MAKYDYITDEIINSIDYIVKERIKDASFDKTRTGRIVGLLDNNKYMVNIDNTEYIVPSISDNVLPLNAIVKVLVPENQYNNMFILSPSSQQGGGGGGSSGVNSVNGKTGDVIIGISDINGLNQQLANKLSNDSDLNSNIVTFTQAAIRSGINSGETLSVILGKIAKWYSDLSNVAFTGDYDDLTNAPEAVTKTSQLTNDSSFISDSNYVHTDNNYTTTEKQKLSGLSNYVLPTASSNTLGGVKSGTDITVDNNGNVSVNNNSHNHTISNITDFPSIDNTPTQNSDNLVKSGGVKSALDDKISEPSNDGTSGQVLMTNGSGTRYWGTVSGGGGTNDYTQLTNKPHINSVTLTGNKSLSDLGIAAANGVINATDLTISNGSVNLIDYVDSPGVYKVPSDCIIYTDSAMSTTNRISALSGDIVKIEPQIDTGTEWEIVEFTSYFNVFGSALYTGAMVTADNTTWTSVIVPYEHQGNKVTTISSSSRDTRYPSAKAVYDYSAQKSLYGDDSINLGRKTNTTIGNLSIAFGTNSTASGSYSYAEGNSSVASGAGSHAEGYNTTASAQYSHSEGYQTTASGLHSHAEGRSSTAQRRSQHVIGEYNVLDTEGEGVLYKGKYIDIVGNGTSTSERSNAYTLDWDGVGWFADSVKVGGTGQDDTNAKELATKDYVDQSISTAINTYITTAINGSY